MATTTVKAQDVIDEARTWIGTPFMHQGRMKGKGVDCVGLLIGVAHALGLSDFDFRAYGRIPVPEQMKRLLEMNLIQVDLSQIRCADVLWLKLGQPRHIALFTEKGTIIHVNERIGKSTPRGLAGRCVEHILDQVWRQRIVAVYRIPGVE